VKTTLAVFVSLVVMNAAPAVRAATYTIKQNGTGDYTTIQACANAAKAGDTCLVSAGTYNEAVSVPSSGASGKPITFQAAPGPKPTVSKGFTVTNRDHITIKGFVLNGWVRCSPFSGSPCNWIKIVDNDITSVSIGIQLRAHDVLISGNTFNNMSGDMIRQHGDRWTIRNNTVINESDSGDVHMDFWQSFCAGGLGASHTLIENNEFIDVTGGNVHFALVNGTSSCNDPVTNTIYRHNKVRNIGSLAIYIDTNKQAAGCKDNVIYNNTFIDLSGGTFQSSQDYACPLTASASSSALNNILYNAMDSTGAEGFLFAAGGFSDYNLYYDPAATMTFASPASGEVHAVKNSNPLLADPSKNDFSLKAGSPAIDKGGALTHVAAADTGAGTSLVVEGAEFFQPGWGGADPDTIAVGSVSNVVKIASIDYKKNTLTLASAITRSAGDPVFLYKDSDGTRVLHGKAPDIGAQEYKTGNPATDGGVNADGSAKIDGGAKADGSAKTDTSAAAGDGAQAGDAGDDGTGESSSGCSCSVAPVADHTWFLLMLLILIGCALIRPRA
jgi:hypothetical protein